MTSPQSPNDSKLDRRNLIFGYIIAAAAVLLAAIITGLLTIQAERSGVELAYELAQTDTAAAQLHAAQATTTLFATLTPPPAATSSISMTQTLTLYTITPDRSAVKVLGTTRLNNVALKPIPDDLSTTLVSIPFGTSLEVLGRTADDLWLHVRYIASDLQIDGWLTPDALILKDVDDYPVALNKLPLIPYP